MSSLADDIEYAERGTGPALLMLPGSFGTGAAWKGVIGHLGDRFRVVTTSLQGYGRTRERRSSDTPTAAEQIELIDALIGHIGAPVHVVGHSYGAFCALAHALHGRCPPESLTLLETTQFSVLRAAGDTRHSDMVDAMTRVYFSEFAQGRPDAARHVIDFYEGAGSFDALPQKARDYVMETTPTNVRDWATAGSFAPELAAYAHIRVPTLLVRGGAGHPAVQRTAELLASSIPGARLETIAGGRHMLPATHPAECAALIRAHVGSPSA